MIKAFIKHRKKIKLRNNKIAQLLNDLADITVGTIKSDTKKGKDIEGNPFKRLKQSTINAKRKKGSKTPTKPLMDTGLMRKVFRSKTASASDLASRDDVAKKRSEIAVFHNDGGSRIPQREWFGIGDKSKKRMNKMIKAKIKQIVRLVK